MSINRLPEFTFVFIVCLVDFVWKYRFGGERFPTKKTDIFFYQLTPHLLDANPITVEILFFFVSGNQNLGEICMHFELQVGSPWINLAEIWSSCC